MSLPTNAFDPQEDEGRKRSSHMTKKEARILGVIGVLLVAALIPVYQYFIQLRNSAMCTRNLSQVASAIGQYATDNNDRFPVTYVTSDEGYEPKLFAKGTVSSWVTLLSSYTGTTKCFRCPSADDQEDVLNVPGVPGAPIESSYGMYAAYSAFPKDSVASPSSTVLVIDSSNGGANGTFDPLAMKNGKGEPVPDGIVIGLDTSNFFPNDNSLDKLSAAQYATRVAMPDSGKFHFDEGTRTRHPDGVNLLMADLHFAHIRISGAHVDHAGKNTGIKGIWQTPSQ